MELFYESNYGRHTAPKRIVLIAKALVPYLKSKSRWIDIGCGNMDASSALVRAISNTGSQSEIVVSGWDVSNAAVQAARLRGFNAKQLDVSSRLLDDQFREIADVVLFLEIIEHLADTDTALKNIHQILSLEGVVVISTPNLAAWYNRILLVAGFQPHATEVSYVPRRFGCQFISRLLREKSDNPDTVAGHLRAFTLRALKELIRYHGFKINNIIGVSNHRWDLVGRCIARIWPGAAGNVVIIASRDRS